MTDTALTQTSIVLKMAARKPKPARKKRGKALAIFLPAGVLLLGGLFIAPYAQAHVKAAIVPTVTGADAIADEAKTLDEEYETICSNPAWDEGVALTGGTGSGEVMDGITGTCTALGVKGQAYVEKVEAATSIWTDLGDGLGEVTESVRAAVDAGDIETAIRILFAQSEEAGA